MQFCEKKIVILIIFMKRFRLNRLQTNQIKSLNNNKRRLIPVNP